MSSTTIIVGSNNTSIGSTAIIGGSNNTISTCGSQGLYRVIGTTGMQGTAGPAGYITDWKEELQKKYPRFTIKTEYDSKTMAPTIIINDTANNYQEYRINPKSVTNTPKETEQLIQEIIINIRQVKINNILD